MLLVFEIEKGTTNYFEVDRLTSVIGIKLQQGNSNKHKNIHDDVSARGARYDCHIRQSCGASL